MSVADYRLREEILQMISQCSSNHHLNEGCSLGYAELNPSKLKDILYATYHSYCGLDRGIRLTSAMAVRDVIDIIVKNIPIRAQNRSLNSQEKSHSYSETVEGSNKGTTSSVSMSTSTINMEKRKCKYVIGIDLGHGETSAAMYPLQWDGSQNQRKITDLELAGNKQAIPSAITILDNGDAYIGDLAFDPERLKQAEVHVCFKKKPQNINGESERLMIRFMQEVYNCILERNSGLLTKENHLVYIATPSGWDKKAQALYKEMARQAGLPIAGVTKESRAAFVLAQHDPACGIGRYVSKGAIVFDMGSSTLDFTYMTYKGDKEQVIDYGYDCGASYIEKVIYDTPIKGKDVLKVLEEKHPNLAPAILFKARDCKEQCYKDPESNSSVTIDLEDYDSDFDGKQIKFKIKAKELDTLLEQVGYMQKIKNAASDFLKNHIHNAPIYGVFLTGGASRMGFIKPLISKCWNIDEKQIYQDNNPSLSISRGVAEVASMDLETEGMDEGLEDAINQLQNSDTIYNTFIEKFCYALWDRITDEVGGTVTAFRDAEEDYSLSDLQNAITRNVQEGINEVVPNLSVCIQDAITENAQDIQNKVESIISHYSNQGLNISMPKLEIHEIDTGDVDLDDVIKSISEKIASESEDWTGAIVGGAIGGAIALLLGGPLAWIIGGAAFLGQLFFGKSDEEKKLDAMMKDLDKGDRSKVFDSIKDQWEKIQKDIDESVYKAVSRNSEIKQSINLAVFQLLQGYKESLKKARILID